MDGHEHEGVGASGCSDAVLHGVDVAQEGEVGMSGDDVFAVIEEHLNDIET
jgi:hypothetical protein